MFRFSLSVVAVLFLVVGPLWAAEKKGTIKAIDVEKMTLTLTLTVDSKDSDFRWTKETKFVDVDSGEVLGGGPKAKRFAVGKEVTITTEKKDDKEIVTTVAGKKPS